MPAAGAGHHTRRTHEGHTFATRRPRPPPGSGARWSRPPPGGAGPTFSSGIETPSSGGLRHARGGHRRRDPAHARAGAAGERRRGARHRDPPSRMPRSPHRAERGPPPPSAGGVHPLLQPRPTPPGAPPAAAWASGSHRSGADPHAARARPPPPRVRARRLRRPGYCPPTTFGYDEPAARDAWQDVLAWFATFLRGTGLPQTGDGSGGAAVAPAGAVATAEQRRVAANSAAGGSGERRTAQPVAPVGAA